MASGINTTFRQVGIATGIAALGAVFQARVESKLDSLLAGTPAAGRTHELPRRSPRAAPSRRSAGRRPACAPRSSRPRQRGVRLRPQRHPAGRRRDRLRRARSLRSCSCASATSSRRRAAEAAEAPAAGLTRPACRALRRTASRPSSGATLGPRRRRLREMSMEPCADPRRRPDDDLPPLPDKADGHRRDRPPSAMLQVAATRRAARHAASAAAPFALARNAPIEGASPDAGLEREREPELVGLFRERVIAPRRQMDRRAERGQSADDGCAPTSTRPAIEMIGSSSPDGSTGGVRDSGRSSSNELRRSRPATA